MRTESSIKNVVYALGGQGVHLIVSLIARMVFVKILTKEYLGLDGLFSNILTVLSLLEIGIGPAITFSLYKPLSENNKEKIKSLMKIYKTTYIIVALLILILGVNITPLLPSIIKEMPDIKEINLIYILFVINTSSTYFFSYKRTLLEADQKRYLSTLYQYGFKVILNVLQMIVLFITRNYLVFLIIQILVTITENVLISRKVGKMYPFIKEKDTLKLPNEDKNVLTKNVVAMFMHKVGTIAVDATDNIIIAKYIGLGFVAMYSNYFLIVNALRNVLFQIFSSMIASVGNLGATESKEKLYDVFKKVFFLNFWIFSFCSIALVILLSDFINIWLGESYVLDIATVITIIISFYVSGSRRTALTFKDALGLYWQDRYRPIAEAIINIIVSIILAKKIGLIGVFIGTIVSGILTYIWIEPVVLFKYGLKKSCKQYFIKYIEYTLLTIATAFLTIIICNYISTIVSNMFITFILKVVICIIIPNIIYIILFYRTDEFKYFIELIKILFSKFRK